MILIDFTNSSSPSLLKKTTDTITKFVMVIMGLVLVLMETIMDPVGFHWLLVVGLLKPLNPNGICPKIHYRRPFLIVLMVKR